jgi:hypothetical protein
MSPDATAIELECWAHFWPRDGRLHGLHRIAIGKRIAAGELPQAAQLHAIADVVLCATAAERRHMLAAEISEEGSQ